MTTRSSTLRPSDCAIARRLYLHRRVEVDDVARARPDDQLLHVDVGRVQQPAALRRRQHRQRIRRAGRAEVRPFERIDRDVDLRIRPAGVPCAPMPTFSPM